LSAVVAAASCYYGAVSPRKPSKREVLLALLQQSPTVFVSFDPRQERVVLPSHLRRAPRLLLQYGLNMTVPIPDLDVGAEGVGATLSFSGSPSWTFVPWSSVFAIICDDEKHGMVWEEDIPKELLQPRASEPPPASKRPAAIRPVPAAAPAVETAPPARVPAKKGAAKRDAQKKKPALRAVDGGGEAPSSSPPAKIEARLTVEKDERVAPAPRTASEPTSVPEVAKDEIVEPPPRERKKRELPPYLRVVK
jgi:stringent starvation protein B